MSSRALFEESSSDEEEDDKQQKPTTAAASTDLPKEDDTSDDKKKNDDDNGDVEMKDADATGNICRPPAAPIAISGRPCWVVMTGAMFASGAAPGAMELG